MVAALKTSTVSASIDDSPTPRSGMTFKTTSKDLARATALLYRVSDRKSTMPMLACTLARVDQSGNVTLTATDLNVSLTVGFAGSPGSVGGAAIPTKDLHDLVRKLDACDVEISRSGSSDGTVKVKAGSLASTLQVHHERDYPKVPSGDGLAWHTCNAADLATLIESVMFSVCIDETRFHLNGIHYENTTGEHAIVVSTDGHRLTKAQGMLSGCPSSGVIIPSKGADMIVRVLKSGKCRGSADMAIKDGRLFVRYEHAELAIKLIDAQFPPYEQVVPKDHTKLATVDRKQLIDVLKRISTISSETRGATLHLDSGKLKVSADDPDRGSIYEIMDAEGLFAESTKGYTIGFNPRYLIELMNEIDCDHVTFAFGGTTTIEGQTMSLDPIVLRGTEHAVSYSVVDAPFLGVVMPMQI